MPASTQLSQAASKMQQDKSITSLKKNNSLSYRKVACTPYAQRDMHVYANRYMLMYTCMYIRMNTHAHLYMIIEEIRLEIVHTQLQCAQSLANEGL